MNISYSKIISWKSNVQYCVASDHGTTHMIAGMSWVMQMVKYLGATPNVVDTRIMGCWNRNPGTYMAYTHFWAH